MAQPNRSNFEQTELGRFAVDRYGRSISMPEGSANDLGLASQGTYTESLNPNGQIINDATNQKLNRPSYATIDKVMYYPEELGYTDRIADSPTNIMKFSVLDFEGGLLHQEGEVLTTDDFNDLLSSFGDSPEDANLSLTEKTAKMVKSSFSDLVDPSSIFSHVSKKATYNKPLAANVLKDVIYLYTPENITTNYGFNYKDDDLTPTYKMLDLISGDEKAVKDIAKQSGVGFINSMLKSVAGNDTTSSPGITIGSKKITLGKTLAELGKLSNTALGGNIDLDGIIRAKTRATPIQNLEYLFENVVRRQFEFTFKFYPKSKKEVEMVGKIIAAFKFYAHPNLNADTPRYLGFPSVFQIEHLSWIPVKMDNGVPYGGVWAPNLFVNQYKTAALNSIQVNYTDTGVFSTLEAIPQDGSTSEGIFKAPVGISLTLNFQELRILNRNDMTDPKDFLNPTRDVNTPNNQDVNIKDSRKNSRYH